MNKLLNSLILILLLGEITSCNSDPEPVDGGRYRTHKQKEKPVLKTLRMSFGGDVISETEEPLLRAEDGDTYVAINVFCTEKDVDKAKEMPYAYGLFSGLNGISIDLITGFTYRFESAILIEKDDKLWDHGASRYGKPFSTSNGNADFDKSDMNKFITDGHNFRYLLDGTAFVDAGDDLPARFGQVWFPRVKRYYGSVDAIDPSFMTDVEIAMEYKCFGLKLYLASIPDNTSVSVSDISDKSYGITPEKNPEYYLCFPKDLSLSNTSEQSKTWEGVFSLNELSRNTQEFKLQFVWNKGSGITEKFVHTFTVEAKKKKVLSISIEGEINETKSGNLSFTSVDDTLTEEEPEVVTNVKN